MRSCQLLVALAMATSSNCSVARVHSSHTLASSSSRRTLFMRSLPADVKGLVDELRISTQAAITAQLSRLDIEIPLGMGLMSGKTANDVHASSRELARIFCEMFSQLEASTAVAFPTDALAKAAALEWGSSVKAKCVSLGGGKGSASGFGGPVKKSSTRAGGVPPGTDIVFAVGPLDGSALSSLEALSRRVGKGVLIVLLNGHLDSAAAFASPAQLGYFQSEFERVFCFRPLRTSAEPNAEELLVYRAFPEQWTLARMRASGRPLSIAQQPGLFSREQIEAALVQAGPVERNPLDEIGSFFSQIGGSRS